MLRKAIATIGIAAAALATGVPAEAAEWRLATDQVLDSAEGKAYERFAQLSAQYSGGELSIKIFPYGQLGGEKAMLEQLRAGVVHINPNALTSASKWVPDMQYISAPFVFEGREHWRRFLTSGLVQGWFKEVEEKAGVIALGDPAEFLRGPYRVMVSTKPVNGLDDLKGLKLRMHNEQLAIDAWTNLGADVRTLNWGEVYDGLNRRLVEAANAPVAQVEATRFYEAAKHIARHDEYWQGVAFWVNAKAYRGLSPKAQEALNRAYGESAALATELVTKTVDDSLARMKKHDVTYRDLDTGPFVKRMQQFYAERAKAGKLPNGFLAAVDAAR